jgi:organic hydroperoxide reductase OsmC/OhrA
MFPDTKFPQTFPDSKFQDTAQNREDLLIGFVAACVNGNMNPVLKRSGFVMNPKNFALV